MGHGGVPVEVERGFDDHEEAIVDEVDFHFEDSDFAYALTDFGPLDFRGVEAAIFGDEFGLVFEVEGLTVAFDGSVVFFDFVSLHSLWV